MKKNRHSSTIYTIGEAFQPPNINGPDFPAPEVTI